MLGSSTTRLLLPACSGFPLLFRLGLPNSAASGNIASLLFDCILTYCVIFASILQGFGMPNQMTYQMTT